MISTTEIPQRFPIWSDIIFFITTKRLNKKKKVLNIKYATIFTCSELVAHNRIRIAYTKHRVRTYPLDNVKAQSFVYFIAY